MSMRYCLLVAFVAALVCGASSNGSAQQSAGAVTVGNADLGGVVRSANGPEAGVWVIAETTDLPTKFIKIVVTDDQGRYVLPELPKANYSVWVRGYGLVDSPKVRAAPGKILDLTAVVAPNEKAAAEYYPAQWWYSMMQHSREEHVPRHRAEGQRNGDEHAQPDAVARRRQVAGLRLLPSDGQQGDPHHRSKTRQIRELLCRLDAPHAGRAGRRDHGPQHRHARFADRDQEFRRMDRSDRRRRTAEVEAFASAGRRTQRGDHAVGLGRANRLSARRGRQRPAQSDGQRQRQDLRRDRGFDRSRAGARPRHPHCDADQADDPHAAEDRPGMFISQQPDFPKLPSPVWGEKPLWGSHTTPHNPMFDHKGRVWFTSRIREAQTPAFCRKGSDHPSAKLFPIERAGRQLSMYDPETGKLTLIDTCFTTHHLNFAEDENHTLWLSAGGFRSGYVGWFNVKMFEETGDEARSQGWSPIILDTNGNGKRDEGYVGPNDQVDPTKDKHILAALYAIALQPGRQDDLGHGADLSRRHRADRSRRQSAGDRAGGILRGAARRATVRAAATSTATASTGHRSRADTSAVSIAQSARAR